MAELDPKVVRWVNQQAAQLKREGWEPGSPREKNILAQWRLLRPKMYKELVAANLAAKMAQVLDFKRYQAEMAYIQGGMPPTDAREQATLEWLILEPESTRPNLPRFDRTSTSLIQSL